MIYMADLQCCCLIVTTGGTGPSKRDVTPEATQNVSHRMMPGFGELMRQESLKFVPTAILSRQTAGLRDDTLIVNLPGKPKSIRECLDAVFPAIPYCIDLMEGPYLVCDESVIKPFRPKAK
jgi:molybdopterin adenylyltransferase